MKRLSSLQSGDIIITRMNDQGNSSFAMVVRDDESLGSIEFYDSRGPWRLKGSCPKDLLRCEMINRMIERIIHSDDTEYDHGQLAREVWKRKQDSWESNALYAIPASPRNKNDGMH
ncbi:MAG: hypothetical protein AAB483_03720 [Patescibacteria group bacterium]